ncbi:MAG: alpha/beta hydrolase [Dehalococcoidia bacterium]|nr:alpha/beta hydrolase [Dehalococcoidia bacterium]
MARATANGIELEYDTFGEPGAAPLLLVMGLGAQMLAWDEEFCRQLAGRGHHVIRFDNRDVGLSTKFEAAGAPDVVAALTAAQSGQPVDAPYTLRDMADDAVGLLDALGIPAAHIVGASMGGMIVQQMAIDHPSRVLTMTSIMSSTGEPGLPPSSPEANAALLTPAPTDREGNIEFSVSMRDVIGSKGVPFDEAKARRMAATMYDRSFYPVGMARQLVGIVASGSRKEGLAGVTCPTLVIHGDIDPLVRVEAGQATAAAVPGAKLLIIEGMGHDLPEPYWPRIIDAIAGLTGGVKA